MKGFLLDGPFAGELRDIVGAESIEPKVLAGRCSCCDRVTLVVPKHRTVGLLQSDGVLFVTYRIETIASDDTVAYRVWTESHDPMARFDAIAREPEPAPVMAYGQKVHSAIRRYVDEYVS